MTGAADPARANKCGAPELELLFGAPDVWLTPTQVHQTLPGASFGSLKGEPPGGMTPQVRSDESTAARRGGSEADRIVSCRTPPPQAPRARCLRMARRGASYRGRAGRRPTARRAPCARCPTRRPRCSGGRARFLASHSARPHHLHATC